MHEARWSWIEQVAAKDPGAIEPALGAARIVREGRMPLFSHTPVDFSSRGDWSCDAILGRCAPSCFYGRIPYLDASVVGDSKHVWEPSRFGFVYWLALADRLEPAGGYAKRFVELASGWFKDNPYPRGIHYCSALEVGLRAYAWIWALALFRERLEREPRLLTELLEGIWTACHHVEANLSTYFSPNTHLLGEGFSLFACAAALPEFRESSRWRKLGTSILESEASRQFHADGTHRELSSGYHLYSTDYYLQAVLIAREAGFDLPIAISERAHSACARLADLVPCDGILPQWNDCDGGRVIPFGESPLDARPTLRCARVLSSKAADLPLEPQGYSLLMEPLPGSGAPPPLRADGDRPRPLDSGIVAWRSPRGDYVVFRASPFGFGGCPHSHDAPLSLIVHLRGFPVVVDNGTGHYSQDLAVRNRLRSAEGKSVLLVGGSGPSRAGGWFDWERRTDCELLEARAEPHTLHCTGRHEGFQSGGESVTVTREVAFADDRLTIVDRWRAAQPIAVATSLTLAPGVVIDLDSSRLILPNRRTVGFTHSTDLAARVREARIPYSPDYGLVGETSALICDLDISRSGECRTELAVAHWPTDSADLAATSEN